MQYIVQGAGVKRVRQARGPVYTMGVDRTATATQDKRKPSVGMELFLVSTKRANDVALPVQHDAVNGNSHSYIHQKTRWCQAARMEAILKNDLGRARCSREEGRRAGLGKGSDSLIQLHVLRLRGVL